MFTRNSVDPQLQEAIDSLYRDLSGHTGETDDYAKVVEQLIKLENIKTSNRPDRPSMDALITAGANILGIVMIVGHERTHIVTSKALGFVLKLR